MRRIVLLTLVSAVCACGEVREGSGSGAAATDSATVAAALPPGHVPISSTNLGKQLTPTAQALLDSGNASFRANRHPEALAFYRRAAAEVPGHAAPWFGAYMAARAMDDSALADSAMRMVRARAPGIEGHPSAGAAPKSPRVSPHGSAVR